LRSSRFWHPESFLETGDVRDIGTAAAEFGHLLAQAVRRSVTGNDAIALSGGLDSTTIAALAVEPHRDLGENPPLAVSAIYPDLPSVDESDLIRLMADEYGLRLSTFRPKARPLDDLDMWVDLLDGPGSTLSMPEIHEMYALARADGAERILTGELGEYVYALRYQTLGHLVWKGRWAGARAHVAYERGRDRTWSSLSRELTRSLAPGLALHYWSRRRSHKSLPPWVDPAAVSPILDRDRIPPVGDRWPFLQLRPVVGDYALAFDDVDVASSLSGITVRYPLVDRDLWEFCLSLRAEVKYPTPRSKDLLRRAMNGILPDEIVNRSTKTFFTESGLRNFSPNELADWIDSDHYRFDGIDYKKLRQRLSSDAMSIQEIDWAQNLARCHAFLTKWN
jgi:asparagine synthase (glutamine-hydrolysing)